MRIIAPILAVLFAITAFVLFAQRGGSPDPAADTTATETASVQAQPETTEPDTAAEEAAAATDTVEQAAADAIDQAADVVEAAAETLVDALPEAASGTPAAEPVSLRILTAEQLDERQSAEGATPGGWSYDPVSLGSTDETTGFLQEVALHRFGASVDRLAMSEYNNSVAEDAEPYVVLDKIEAPNGAVYRHFAANRLWVNDQLVKGYSEAGQAFDLSGVWWPNSGVTASGDQQSVTFLLAVVDEAGAPLVDVYRTYRLTKGSYDLALDQKIVNRSDEPVQVRFDQYLQADIERDAVTYMGDRRQVVVGAFSPARDPQQVRVYTDGGFYTRDKAISRVLKGKGGVWPDPDYPGDALAWLATENRYFAVATHTEIPTAVTDTAGVQPLSALFPYLFTDPQPRNAENPVLTFLAQTDPIDLLPGAEHPMNLGFFAGPRTKTNFQVHPYDILDFGQMIKYELGCTWCTFQWLAKGLLAFLNMIHGVVGDWGVAIIVLVLCVRLILHPITKKSQVNMMVFGKQMQAMQPEMEKLKKKYGDSPQKMQQEQIKLWREHGVNPLRMLGCLPMFLQMPIWVALYAMIYFAVELWQQPAFYGVFQAVGLNFLSDLAVPDRLIVFSETPIHAFGFQLIDFSSFNILPLIWTVINIVNMKLTQPPAMTDQAAQQQKIMRVMMVLFAFWLYSAPAALTLYMCASTSIGILDAMFVRRHVKKMEAEGKLLPTPKASSDGEDDSDTVAKPKAKKPPKPGSFRAKLQARMEMAQKMMEEQQKMREQQLKNQGQADNTMGGNRAQRRASKRRQK